MTAPALFVISTCSFADEVHVKGGRTVSGLISDEGKDYVIVAIPGGGELKIKKEDIASIEESAEEEREKLKEEIEEIKGEALKRGRDKMNYGGKRHSSADSVPAVLMDTKKASDAKHVTAGDSTRRKNLFSILQERRKAKVRAVTGISKKKAREEKEDEKE